jgi:hypothetical protein
MNVARSVGCDPPFSQGVVDQWGSVTEGAISPASYASGVFVYRGGPEKSRDKRVVVSGSRVEVLPSCSYLPRSAGSNELVLETRNMCPALLSGGRHCSTVGKCTFHQNTCPSTSSVSFRDTAETGRCVYDIDLLQDGRDVSYLLRSTAASGTSQFPVKAAAALMDNFTQRMRQAADRGDPTTTAAKANAWCIVSQNKTLGSLQLSPDQDYTRVRDPFGDDWGALYWSQLDWLAAVMQRPTGASGGETCIVDQNCEHRQWNKFFGAA